MPRLAYSFLVLLANFASVVAESPRRTIFLNGSWQFRQDGEQTWKRVEVPCSWETHEGMKFDGIGWYEKTIDPVKLPEKQRLLLHFDAVATEATVWFDDVKLGSHLGGWTPFRFDVTELIRKNPDKQHTIRVRVDEKVGHNTQGFLPIIAPHFGGMWQWAKLIVVPEYYVDDLNGHAAATPSGPLQARFQLAGKPPGDAHVRIKLWQRGPERKLVGNWTAPIDKGEVNTAFPNHGMKTWTPATPALYDLEVLVIQKGKDANSMWNQGDAWTWTCGSRSIETKADQFLLNGKALSIRGVLNWGYYPPLVCPDPNPERWRQDLKLIKSWGFNLMKCCLWIPPKRYLEIADEEGVLIWMEYPAWHPKFTKEFLPDLEREYTEFFQHDRNHPSVILRSLTCETGQGADIKVIQSLYDKAKAMIPGCLVVDDSSWIEWNRVYDFFDDHPYGNNHTWVATLQRLKNYVQKKGVKPLILGEAIAADTWTNPDELLKKYGKDRPWWLPLHLDANKQWLERMGKVTGGPVDQKRLTEDSLKYAWLMRKYQIETFRREVPNGGYVVSVLRDFRLASMGLLDYEGKPKWNQEDWYWQNDTMLMLKPANDRRTYPAGQVYDGQTFLSHFGKDRLLRNTFTVRWKGGDVQKYWWVEQGIEGFRDDPNLERKYEHVSGSVRLEPVVENYVDRVSETVVPQPFMLSAAVNLSRQQFNNYLTIWVLPRAGFKEDSVFFHPLCSSGISELFHQPKRNGLPRDGIYVTQILDESVLNHLEAGGRVLLLPNGQTNSFPLRSHWFLRGGPFVNTYHPLIKSMKNLHELLVETQHFDLAGDVIPDMEYLEEIDPILMLWDNHDIPQVKTHGLVFETRVGKGRLLVSALKHTGKTNSGGKWLIDVLLEHLDKGPIPKNGFSDATIQRLRLKLKEKTLDLTRQRWNFKPDGKNIGVQENWHTAKVDDTWKPIRVGQHWEGQGHPNLDGWAWFRLNVAIPKDWDGLSLHLNLEGVDDYYEVFINGQKMGSGGDIEKKQTAFEEKKSLKLPEGIKPGQEITIAVRVYDWYGAGGIHRPLRLSTVPHSEGSQVLR
jgi:hypothetical protein